ncbi:glycosyltransferase family 9 protein [Paracnuella aquatica]|uniref:glycosyltransferase family 9 protein n=1 Tax=Paracnuella aquatica TaxID=2268757 RepID=UPI000DEEC516|nr:glycosyltransferase family 9 protein [Paracnuella aquatica]RPD43651.1 glycosyltransferase family 9 protein [Paracnuella aquatica]
MTVPVIKNLLHQYPHLEVTVVSTAFHAPLFAGIDRLHFFAADLKRKHKGFAGLFRLFKELTNTRKIDAVSDLHHVLRTCILRLFFTVAGFKWASVDKGRAEKKALTRPENKILQPLKSTFQRYADVFAALGLPVQLNVNTGIKEKGPMPAAISGAKKDGTKLIGIAPFAQYSRKTYPAEKMKEVLRLLAQHPQLNIYLLGGKADVPILQEWAAENKRLQVIAGTLSFAEELQFIAHLDAVVSMDSANMHLASMYGVPVVSIWGATHPFAGFYGWGQAPKNAVQIDLDCRPCSVFGNKPGPRPDLACMHGIAPLSVYNRVMGVLGL